MPTLKVNIDGDTSGLKTALDGLKGHISGIGSALAGTRIGAVVEVTKKVAEATVDLKRTADDVAARQTTLENAVNATGVSYKENERDIQAMIDKSVALGNTQDDTIEAFKNLLEGTQDFSKAVELMPAVEEIVAKAKFEGKSPDMSLWATQVANEANKSAAAALAGGPSPELSTGMKSLFTNAQTWDEIRASLTDETAKAWAESGEGSKAIMEEKLQNLKESFALFAQSFIQPILDIVTKIGDAFTHIKDVILPPLQAVIEGIRDIIDVIKEKIYNLTHPIETIKNKWGEVETKVNDVDTAIENLGPPPELPQGRGGRYGTGGGATPGSVPGVGQYAASNNADNRPAMVMNIYGSPAVIEARVTRALRDYSRRNGPGAVFTPGRS